MRQTRSSSWVLTGIWLALLSAATTAVAAALLFYVPGQKRIFDEFGLQLPTLSRWVIRASSFVAAYWWVLVPAVLAALCGIVLVVRHAFGLRTFGNVIAVVALTLLVGFGLLIPFAMAKPMDDLMRGLAK